MKNWKRYFLGAMILPLILGSVWVVNLIWFKPFDIDLFYDRSFYRFVLRNPEMLSSLRIIPASLEWYEDDLADESIAEKKVYATEMRATLETLRRYDRASQTPSQRLSTDILDWFVDQQVRGEPFQFYNHPINQLFGIQITLPDFMAEIHQIQSLDDAEDYLVRLSKFGVKFDQVLEGLTLREQMGILPPDFIADKVLVGMRSFVATPVRKNILYSSYHERIGKLAELDQTSREKLDAQAVQKIETVVYPAYGKLIRYFEHIRPKLSHDAGVWALPNGDAYYAHELRGNTTTDYTPDEVHQLGLEQVASISAQMRAILDAQGHSGGTVGDWMEKLSKEPRFLYADTPQAQEQILKDYQQIIDEVDAGIGTVFSLRPKAKVVVKPVPEYRQKTAPIAYYNPPPRDGSQPGVFYANLQEVTKFPKYGMRTLAYHEAIPGHHFQIAIAQELQGIPQFRSLGLFTAYAEGWAMYAEQLAAEQGYLDDPYDRLGHLQAALFRAVRLVVDTGIHAKRWSREQAIQYMRDTTGVSESDVVAEVERYVVMPGQACAYMVGKLKILELRERARHGLGDRFSEKGFHDVVLKNGAVPLAILDQLVNQWIAETRASASR